MEYSQNCPPLAGNVDGIRNRNRNGNFDFIHSRNKSKSVTELESITELASRPVKLL